MEVRAVMLHAGRDEHPDNDPIKTGDLGHPAVNASRLPPDSSCVFKKLSDGQRFDLAKLADVIAAIARSFYDVGVITISGALHVDRRGEHVVELEVYLLAKADLEFAELLPEEEDDFIPCYMYRR